MTTHNDDLNDDLDELFNSAVDAFAAKRQAAQNRADETDGTDDYNAKARREARMPADFVPAVERTFTEPCTKCRGTGWWRPGYSCFTCNGTGRKTFKTAPAARERNREQAATRKAARVAGDLEAFAAREPQVHAWINEECAKTKPFEFAVAMANALMQYGDLTERQLETCRRLAAKAAERKAEREARKAAAPAVDSAGVDRLKAAFDNAIADAAKRGLTKSPRITIGNLTISPAKANSANPGALYVKDGGDYLGKVVGGRFHAVFACTDAQRAKVQELIADPEAAAKTYGRETGTCCVCNATLISEWRHKGIGPICAEKFGWGA